MFKYTKATASALAALGALLLAASGQQVEDRPLPASPCPDVFSYEGATVDWDRWYGVVLVATDTPLTGLRLDVWLSRPALALRHNWDGNVTTQDNKRFTILNLYKRIEPGPPKSVRIVVKFDEKEEIPVLRAVELNGRRICSSRNSKYNFDRTTQRAAPAAHRNAVGKRPPSNVADEEYERAAAPAPAPARRPPYADDADERRLVDRHTMNACVSVQKKDIHVFYSKLNN
ncbi:Uncharacterized protein GBIM_07785 [Gryllus bimaculatus]|nr:Uncharacterized protein GBIM_07785 [Gryllus bimaculatus]